jgi:threonine aldolase
MLTSTLKKQYQAIIKKCQYSLKGHPKRSMAQCLQEIIPLAQAYDDPDVYGEGQVIEDFEQQVATLLGKEAAVFLPSGTMAQPIALRIWADRNKSKYVGFHATSHLELHEHKSYQALHGLQSVLLGQPPRVINLEDLQNATDPLAAVLLELPMREIGGQLPDWVDLKAQSDWAKQNNIALHMDGARLWQCTEYYQKSLSEISELFDSVYVSFYKDLDGIAGAVLAGPQWFVQSARIWSRRAGGNLIAQYPYVLAAKAGLEKNLPLLPKMVETTALIAEHFNRFEHIQTLPAKPPTAMFHLRIDQSPELLIPKIMVWSERTGVALFGQAKENYQDNTVFEMNINTAALELTIEQWRDWIDDFAGEVF